MFWFNAEFTRGTQWIRIWRETEFHNVYSQFVPACLLLCPQWRESPDSLEKLFDLVSCWVRKSVINLAKCCLTNSSLFWSSCKFGKLKTLSSLLLCVENTVCTCRPDMQQFNELHGATWYFFGVVLSVITSNLLKGSWELFVHKDRRIIIVTTTKFCKLTGTFTVGMITQPYTQRHERIMPTLRHLQARAEF